MQDLIKSTLEQILTELQLPFSGITILEDGDIIRVDIESPQASRLIGWHGETIDSVQHILKSIIRSQKRLERAPFIILDVDGYHKMQEEKVCSIAEQKIDFVRRKKTRIALPPMSPYFRRVVHTYISNHPDYTDITTESVGEGEYRQIVLKLKKGSLDEGEELQPVIASGKEEVTTGDGFENLDV